MYTFLGLFLSLCVSAHSNSNSNSFHSRSVKKNFKYIKIDQSIWQNGNVERNLNKKKVLKYTCGSRERNIHHTQSTNRQNKQTNEQTYYMMRCPPPSNTTTTTTTTIESDKNIDRPRSTLHGSGFGEKIKKGLNKNF